MSWNDMHDVSPEDQDPRVAAPSNTSSPQPAQPSPPVFDAQLAPLPNKEELALRAAALQHAANIMEASKHPLDALETCREVYGFLRWGKVPEMLPVPPPDDYVSFKQHIAAVTMHEERISELKDTLLQAQDEINDLKARIAFLLAAPTPQEAQLSPEPKYKDHMLKPFTPDEKDFDPA